MLVSDIGFPLKGAEVREDIKAVFKTGQFENVQVEIQEFDDGVRLRFVCKERPMVKQISFRGVEKLYDTELSEVVGVKEGEPLRIDKLEKAVKALRKKYDDEGLFNAVIEYRTRQYKDDPNSVEVIFVIDEGEEIKIDKIAILGARKIPSKTLKKVMESEEDGLFKDGDFKKDIYEQDKTKILALYREEGYLDAQILEDRVEYEWADPRKKDKRVIFITIKVTEGERYYFDRYTIAGNQVIESKVFESQFEQIKEGDIFNDTRFQKDRQMISFTYASKGYIFARVVPKRTVEERDVAVRGVRRKGNSSGSTSRSKRAVRPISRIFSSKGTSRRRRRSSAGNCRSRRGSCSFLQDADFPRENLQSWFFQAGQFRRAPRQPRRIHEPHRGCRGAAQWHDFARRRLWYNFRLFHLRRYRREQPAGNGQRVGIRFEYGPSRSSP